MTTRARTLSLVQASPGAYTREVARALGVHESTADYHLHRLRTLGHVASARDGRTLRHYPQPSAHPHPHEIAPHTRE